MIAKIISVFFLILTASCAYSVHQVQMSDFESFSPLEKSGSEVVKASSDQFVIMGFTQNTNYVDDAYHKLMSKCPNGEISPIETRYITDLGFFSWTNHVYLMGLCKNNISKN